MVLVCRYAYIPWAPGPAMRQCFFFPVTISCLPVKLFKKVPVKIRKMAVKILEVKNAPENHKKSQKMAKKRARENQKMPVKISKKVVSRALLGFTGKKTLLCAGMLWYVLQCVCLHIKI